MRQLKFRAWHPGFGEMVYSNMDNEYLSKRDWYPVCFDIGFSHYPHSVNDSETVIMQSTGFVDKRGKEIFEGDILSDWIEVDGKQVQSKLQVYWCKKTGAWRLDSSFAQDKSLSDLLSKELRNFEYEITGNIYRI